MQSSGFNKISVGRLTHNVSKDHISEIFAAYGHITTIELSSAEESTDGCIYQQMIVEFESASDAAKAVKYMNGGMIDAHEIIVQPVHSVLTDTTNKKIRNGSTDSASPNPACFNAPAIGEECVMPPLDS